jgi:exosome complex RNA-binding protein Rrp42 (RNase PH superfamily)
VRQADGGQWSAVRGSAGAETDVSSCGAAGVKEGGASAPLIVPERRLALAALPVAAAFAAIEPPGGDGAGAAAVPAFLLADPTASEEEQAAATLLVVCDARPETRSVADDGQRAPRVLAVRRGGVMASGRKPEEAMDACVALAGQRAAALRELLLQLMGGGLKV